MLLLAAVGAACGGGSSKPSAADNAQATARAVGQTAAVATRTAFIRPTSTPLPTPLAAGVIIVSAKGAAPDKDATVNARSVPGTECTITYQHPSGVFSNSKGLGTKTVDALGNVSWTWHLSKTTEPGTGMVRVDCGAQGIATMPITIPIL